MKAVCKIHKDSEFHPVYVDDIFNKLNFILLSKLQEQVGSIILNTM